MRRKSTETLVFGALLTALVIVLQSMGNFVRFGPVSISLVLMPIVVGSAMCGIKIGAWLGLVFGFVVLVGGDAATFLVINPLGAIVTVIAKGVACGIGAGIAYKLFEKRNKYVAVVIAAIVCPIVNTGVFLIGSAVFFWDTLVGWAEQAGLGDSILLFMIVGLVGINFVVELVVNLVLSPVIVRMLNWKKKLG